MEKRTSDSVEGIWQGLKVIRGKIALRFFEDVGRKRVGKPAGHQFGDQKRLLDLAEARRKIYIFPYPSTSRLRCLRCGCGALVYGRQLP